MHFIYNAGPGREFQPSKNVHAHQRFPFHSIGFEDSKKNLHQIIASTSDTLWAASARFRVEKFNKRVRKAKNARQSKVC